VQVGRTCLQTELVIGESFRLVNRLGQADTERTCAYLFAHEDVAYAYIFNVLPVNRSCIQAP